MRYIYAAVAVHEKTGRRGCGYVGKSTDLAVRLHEHMYGGTSRCPHPQPWADTVICWKLVFAGRVSTFTAWWLEILFILLFRPWYNYEWNLLNRRRVPKYVAARRERSPAYQLARPVARQPLRFQVFRTVNPSDVPA
jgi:hypothetical protein